MGQNESSSCNVQTCQLRSSADQKTDTVKVNSASLAPSAAQMQADKENAAPPNIAKLQAQAEQKERLRRVEAERRAEMERRQEEERQRREIESRRLEEEKLRREEQEKKRLAAELEEKQRRDHEAALHLQQEEAAQEAEGRRQEAERKEEERKAAEASNNRALEEFLSANGFANVNTRRRKMMKACYPLHEAVQQKNAHMVQLLLAAGATAELKNSASQTPLQLAQKSDNNGSHSAVLQALTAAM